MTKLSSILLALSVMTTISEPRQFADAATTSKTTAKPTSSPVGPSSVSANQGANLTFVLSGNQVPTTDTNSKVDGFVKVFSKIGAQEMDLGTTETIDNDDNPNWLRVFWVLWKKGAGQTLRFVIKDQDTLGRSTDVGQVLLDLDSYVLEKNQDVKILIGTSAAKDKNNQPTGGTGFLNIRKTTPASFRLYARNVPHKDPFNGKSDPYVETYFRRGKNGTNVLIGSTSVRDDEENPDWNETFEFANHQKGTDQYWYFKVLDKDVPGSDFIGDLLLEVDPFVMTRKAKISKLDHSDGKVMLAVTPV